MRDSKTMRGERIVGRRKRKKNKEKEKKELLGKERERGKMGGKREKIEKEG